MKYTRYVDILIMTVLLFYCFNSFAQEKIAVAPTPKKAALKNFNVRFDTNWSITVDKSNEKDLTSARYLLKRLNDEFGISLPIEDRPTAFLKRKIELINLSNGIDENIYLEELPVLKEKGEESYLLDVMEDKVIILANNSPGIFFGIQTFFQLLKRDKENVLIPGVKIIDYSQIKMRAVHFCGADLNKLKHQLEYMSRLKLNAAIFDNWAFYNLEKGNNRSIIEEITVFAREHFIEPIPEFQSFGAPVAIITKEPYCAEGNWVQNEHFRFINDIAAPVLPFKKSLINVIRTETTDIIVKNIEGTNIYKENKDYKVIADKIFPPYSKEIPTKIVKLPEGEIKDGEVVLISYDQIIWQHSFAEWKIPYCPSEPRTYEVMFSALKNVIEVVNPKYISIGHDEIRGMNKDSRCRKRNMSNAELLAEDITKLDDFVKGIDPEVKLLMWDDMLNPWHNGDDENYQVKFGGPPGKTAPALDLIPKDAIMMVWWYDPDDWLHKMENSLDYFELNRFNYFVSCWKDKKNIKDWIGLVEGRKDCLGIIVTTWDGFERNLEGIKYTAEMAW